MSNNFVYHYDVERRTVEELHDDVERRTVEELHDDGF